MQLVGHYMENRPFPSSPRPLYQNEVKCSAFDMDSEMVFHSHASKTQSQEGCALATIGLILKVRVFGTWKWPIIQGFGAYQKNRNISNE